MKSPFSVIQSQKDKQVKINLKTKKPTEKDPFQIGKKNMKHTWIGIFNKTALFVPLNILHTYMN